MLMRMWRKKELVYIVVMNVNFSFSIMKNSREVIQKTKATI
jgi:hypothetical protein